MKIQKSKKTKKSPLILILSISLPILAGVGVYAYIQHRGSTADDTPQSIHESDKEQSKNLQDNPEDKQGTQNTDKPTAPAPAEEGLTKQRVEMESSFDKSSNTLFIRGGINYPVSGGRCFATLTGPTGKVITKDTALLQNPASTDCQTISIPLSELTTGKWSYTLHSQSNAYQGASDSATFSI